MEPDRTAILDAAGRRGEFAERFWRLEMAVSRTGLEDLSNMFTRLQSELEPAGIGMKRSLEDQLRETEADLRPLFKSEENLSAGLGSGGLTYEHAFFKKTRAWSEPLLHTLLQEYRAAEASDPTCLFERLANFFAEMDRAYSHVVSIAELEADKAELKTYAFARSCLRDMADMIEASLQPFLRLRLAVRAVAEGRGRFGDQRPRLSLGALTEKLIDVDPQLYQPRPFGISLSQLRNIAHHSSYRVSGDEIVCEYGNPDRPKKFTCQPRDLIEATVNVQNVYYLHKVAFEFYCTDNIRRIGQAEKRSSGQDVTISDLSKNAILAYGIAAAGFHIMKAARNQFRWAFDLVDRHNRNRNEIEVALQSCTIPFLLQSGPIFFLAFVQSGGRDHRITFNAGMSRTTGPKEGRRYFHLDKNLRVHRTSDPGDPT
ncbi:hypothetical protein [Mesorhizobium sp. M1396]|uniref:hypothetical protein n=1 Tax=Mesorhizobium sp. M1396 TaxID=2957095 RepID=UPI00333B3A92